MDSDENMTYKVILKNENEDEEKIEITFETTQTTGETRELVTNLDLGMLQNSRYTLSLETFCKNHESKEKKRGIQENKNVERNDGKSLQKKEENSLLNSQNNTSNVPNLDEKIDHNKSIDSTVLTLPPAPPSSFQVELLIKRKVRAKWKKPEMLKETGEIQNYWLEYKKEGKDWERICLESNVFEYTFPELHYATTYKFRVSAWFGNKRQSPWSKEESCLTEELNVPTIVKVTCFILFRLTLLTVICVFLYLL